MKHRDGHDNNTAAAAAAVNTPCALIYYTPNAASTLPTILVAIS